MRKKKKKVAIEKVEQIPTESVSDETQVNPNEKVVNNEISTEITSPDIKKEEKKSERIESDQEKMVLELFDGKYIE